MKKTIALSAAVLLLAGCGSKVTCTSKDERNGMTDERKIVATFKGDNLKKEKITETVTYKDKDDAKTSCESAKKYFKEEKDVTVKCSGKKVIVKGSETRTKEEMKETKVTKEDFKKQYGDSYKCK